MHLIFSLNFWDIVIDIYHRSIEVILTGEFLTE